MAETKQHPMLFADHLMGPLLDGRKVQTRRPVKPQPPRYINELHGGELSKRAPYDLEDPETGAVFGWGFQDDNDDFYKCSWRVGDLIWARETWNKPEPGPLNEGDLIVYRADYLDDPHGADGERSAEGRYRKWRPSIHMPKWACRCWMEITDVRVERIQSISDDDTEAEGVSAHMPTCRFWPSPAPSGWKHVLDSNGYSVDGEPECDCGGNSWQEIFAASWNSIYPGTWEENIWVWAMTFRRVDAPTT